MSAALVVLGTLAYLLIGGVLRMSLFRRMWGEDSDEENVFAFIWPAVLAMLAFVGLCWLAWQVVKFPSRPFNGDTDR